MGLHIDASPSTLSGWMYPIKRQRSHPPALVRALRRPLQRQKHCARVFTGQDSQVDVKLELIHLPAREEIKKATMQLKVSRSPGIEPNTSLSVWRRCNSRKAPGSVYQLLGERGFITGPQGYSHSLSAQNKRQKSDCSSYRGIILLSIAGKILARILLNWLIPRKTR